MKNNHQDNRRNLCVHKGTCLDSASGIYCPENEISYCNENQPHTPTQSVDAVESVIDDAIELLSSAHVSTDNVWKRYDTVERLKKLTQLTAEAVKEAEERGYKQRELEEITDTHE